MKLSKNTKAEITDERIVITQWTNKYGTRIVQTVLLDENEWRELKEYVEYEQTRFAKYFQAI